VGRSITLSGGHLPSDSLRGEAGGTTIEQLPVLPGAQAHALALVHDPSVDIAAIAAVVESDPAMTTALLRAANSAASAPINRVTAAERAVTRIGLRGTQRIVAGTVLHSSFGDLERAGIDLDELWRHLLGCALLANREREVLQLIAEGDTNQRIANELVISVKTVEAHKAHIMRKLNARNRTDLIRYAIRNGLVSLESPDLETQPRAVAG
jgi:DNA-binding NarL/FixJ family response regulator